VSLAVGQLAIYKAVGKFDCRSVWHLKNWPTVGQFTVGQLTSVSLLSASLQSIKTHHTAYLVLGANDNGRLSIDTEFGVEENTSHVFDQINIRSQNEPRLETTMPYRLLIYR